MSQLASVLTINTGIETAWGEQVAHQLALAVNAQTLYGPFHSSVICAAEDIAQAVSLLPAAHTSIHIVLRDGDVLADGLTLSLPRNHIAKLIRRCRAHAVGRIVVGRGLEALEVAEFVHLLSKLPEELREHGGLSSSLVKRGVTKLVCEAAGTAADQEVAVDASLLRTCEHALDVIQESAQQARVGSIINASAARALASELADNVIEDRAKLLGLLSMHRHDEYTFQHSLNICLLALALGMAVGLDRARLQELGLAALLHDVGKAWVPLEILRKPERLNKDEFALIQRHPVDGAIYLSGQVDLPAAAAIVAFRHHLRYDQRGYPRLRWPAPADPYSLIVGLADTYEALTSDRPYRRTRSPREALQVMRNSATGQFEPRLLDVFGEMLGRSKLLEEVRDPVW